MTKWMLAAGAAALAMTVPASAEKGGKGQGGDGQPKAGHSQGGGHDSRAVDRGGKDRSDRGSRDRDHEERRADSHGQQSAAYGGQGNGGGKAKEKDKGRSEASAKRRDDDWRPRSAGYDRKDDDFRFVPRWDNRGLVRYDGCPPGLAKKGNGCLPPGLARKVVGTSLPTMLSSRVLGGPYRDWYRDDDRYYYRWDGDYIYRVNRSGGLIDALFPYANRDYYYYPVGYGYPSSYNYYNVPDQYRSYYPDGGNMWYRYGDGAIYSVDPTTQLITGIAALLAGDLSVGQPLPSSYSAYNVPLSYRDRYYDTPDAWYRYNDGYIYRVDPTTQLITAAIDAIV